MERIYYKELRYKINYRYSRNRKIFLLYFIWFIYFCFVLVCWKLIFDYFLEFVSGLQNQRLFDGIIRDIGFLLVDWVSIIQINLIKFRNLFGVNKKKYIKRFIFICFYLYII